MSDKIDLVPSFLKIEQYKQCHRGPPKKIHNPGGFKIFPILYIAVVMSENVFPADIGSARKYVFWVKSNPNELKMNSNSSGRCIFP